ncbi:MAG TPA: TetR/AcrR family transcriptional regulator [Gemmatimonadaceae bacterium]|jgi:AcrR family transcriptional regulator
MDRRQEILSAAAGVFAQHGFRGSTTRRIADAAGVNEVTLFRYFGSKDVLLRAAMEHLAESVGVMALPADPEDPSEELTAWSESFIQHLRLRSSIIRKTMSELEERPEMCSFAGHVPRQASAQLCEYLTTLRKTGFATGDFEPKTAAAMLMGAIFADAMGRDMMPDVYPQPADKAAEKYSLLLLRAIGVENVTGKQSKQTKRPKQLSI